MSNVTVKMTNKGKRQVSLCSTNGIKGEGRGEYGAKKDRHLSRHSYHQGGHQHNNYLTNGQQVFDNCNPQYNEHHVLLSRERSFVRPKSSHFNTYNAQVGGPFMEELHRQRSFHQGQIQQSRRKSGGNGLHTNPRVKPAMEIYRPPTLRGPNVLETNGEIPNYKGMNGASHHEIQRTNSKKTSLNIHAKEFVSNVESKGLHHSKSSSNVNSQHGKSQGLQHSKSGHALNIDLKGENKHHQSSSPPRVHFSDDKENITNDVKSNPPVASSKLVINSPSLLTNPIKRSKSLGSADTSHVSEYQASLTNIGPFPKDVQSSINKAINDPNALSARILMEVVRHVFLRVIESSKYSESTARICIAIIEKEENETFLETLLNTCQEYFQQRNRLLRTAPAASHPGYVNSHPKWIAYMSFLNEMYTQLKMRHVQLMTRRMRNSETAPGLLLLSLLAQCCQICLKEQAVNSLAEAECLFFVLTAVGKDIEVELPLQMNRVMSATRDAFMTTVRVPAVRKTLLQLIEMHAARWQLSAPAVLYYYPGSGGAK